MYSINVLKAVTATSRPFSVRFCIVFLRKFGKDDGGTNQVLSTVRSQDDVPWRSGPLIFISTALTHLAGGSAGREGAAIQLQHCQSSWQMDDRILDRIPNVLWLGVMYYTALACTPEAGMGKYVVKYSCTFSGNRAENGRCSPWMCSDQYCLLYYFK